MIASISSSFNILRGRLASHFKLPPITKAVSKQQNSTSRLLAWPLQPTEVFLPEPVPRCYL